MIEVINRELLIPREEYNIGTNYDDQSEVRQFHLKRITSGGIDLGNLAFSLDIRYANDATDTALLDKEVTDKDIVLTLTIVNSMLQVPGSVIVQIRALGADGALKWTSYFGALFVEDAINFPASYTGSITEIERLEAEFAEIYASEAERKTAESLREAAEDAREDAEDAREDAEDARALAETGREESETAREIAERERVVGDQEREQHYQDALAAARTALDEDYDNALSSAQETLSQDYQEALEDASQTLIGAVEGIKDEALEYAASAASSATDAELSARHSFDSAEDSRLSAQNAAASENILDFYVNYVVPRFVIANNRLYIRDTATQSFIVANNRLYIQNPA